MCDMAFETYVKMFFLRPPQHPNQFGSSCYNPLLRRSTGLHFSAKLIELEFNAIPKIEKDGERKRVERQREREKERERERERERETERDPPRLIL